jgi:hypothetical protein
MTADNVTSAGTAGSNFRGALLFLDGRATGYDLALRDTLGALNCLRGDESTPEGRAYSRAVSDVVAAINELRSSRSLG